MFDDPKELHANNFKNIVATIHEFYGPELSVLFRNGVPINLEQNTLRIVEELT